MRRIFTSLLLALGLFAVGAGSQTKLRVGVEAPEFSAAAIDGGNFDLAALRGKVVLVTFWSTRCEICRNEIPKLNSFNQRYLGKDVALLALSMEPEDRINPFLKKNPFNFHILPNSFGIVLQYADRDRDGNIDMGFPSYFLIDKTGKIAYRGGGWDNTAELQGRIDTLLAGSGTAGVTP